MLFKHVFLLSGNAIKRVCCCFQIHTLNKCQVGISLLKHTCHFMLGSAGKTYLHRVQSKFYMLPTFQLSNKLDFQFSIHITCI